MSCLQTAFESYHFYESKLNWEKIFPKDDLSSTKFMLPLRLITQKPPKYFKEKKEVPENIPPTYGCETNFQDIEGYPSLHSMVTHCEHFSSLEDMEMVIHSLILSQCLVAMEYLERTENTDSVTRLLYQYQAAIRSSHSALILTLLIQC